MQDTLSSCSSSSSFTTNFKFHFPNNNLHNHHHDYFRRKQHLHYNNFPTLSIKIITSPPIPPKLTQFPPPPPPLPPPQPPSTSSSDFQEKLLYLDSIGIDFLNLINSHPQIITTPLTEIKSTISLITSMSFTTHDIQRLVSICPDLLTRRATADILPVFTFLLREVNVNGSDLRRVINRRPRLLLCNVKSQLRPTLYFLQSSVGISKVHKHTYLLSCSVEEKFIPRIDYFVKIGFSHKETMTMFRRFPQLFNYSVGENYEPKLNYFVVEMRRDLKELKKFPQYFSFSLENRIVPRHQCCVERGVCFPLHLLLKTTDGQFRRRLEAVSSCNSDDPCRNS